MSRTSTAWGSTACLVPTTSSGMIEAKDNETVARFSLEFGVRAGAHIVALPAIPISRFERRPLVGLDAGDTSLANPLPQPPAGAAGG